MINKKDFYKIVEESVVLHNPDAKYRLSGAGYVLGRDLLDALESGNQSVLFARGLYPENIQECNKLLSSLYVDVGDCRCYYRVDGRDVVVAVVTDYPQYRNMTDVLRKLADRMDFVHAELDFVALIRGLEKYHKENGIKQCLPVFIMEHLFAVGEDSSYFTIHADSDGTVFRDSSSGSVWESLECVELKSEHKVYDLTRHVAEASNIYFNDLKTLCGEFKINYIHSSYNDVVYNRITEI